MSSFEAKVRQFHLNDKYWFMHIRLIQVAIKPLMRIGVNAPIYIALRDKGLKKIQIFSLDHDQYQCT